MSSVSKLVSSDACPCPTTGGRSAPPAQQSRGARGGADGGAPACATIAYSTARSTMPSPRLDEGRGQNIVQGDEGVVCVKRMGRVAGGMSHDYRCMSHNESALVQEGTNIVAKLAQKFGQLRPL